jgi:hypothetical protein
VNVTHPNLRTAEDPNGPDYLAGAVLQGLARPMNKRLSWSFFQTLIGGICTFGLLPILDWQKRFRDYVTLEQQQLWHLAEWLRLQSKDPQVVKLRQDADNAQFRPDLRLLASLSVAFVAVILFTRLQDFRHHWWPALRDVTYGYRNRFQHWHYLDPVLAYKLFLTWTIGLSAAYAFHWLQVQLHAAAVARFIARFNKIALTEGLTPITAEMPGIGVRPVWLGGALIMLALGAIWGVPMMLAAGAQRRAVRFVSTRNRAALAHRLRAMLLARRPTANVPMPVYLRTLCPNPLCRAPLLDSAIYCPRCGSRVA